MKKHEWRKAEKELYLPKPKAEFVDVPEFNFLSIQGEGNPNAPDFAERIQALYPCCYSIKMGLKNLKLNNYSDFTVYPLEGLWDLNEEGRKNYSQFGLNKDHLIYTLMIRQPDFVNEDLANDFIQKAYLKKKNPLINEVKFIKYKEGPSIQMLHIGSFDDEKSSFNIMEEFALKNGMKRKSMKHREIYLSDFRKVEKSKLKTVLRFQVEV